LGIAFGSINTGLPKDIVQKIIAADKIPITRMESRKEKIGEKKALVGQLTQLVESMRADLQQNANERSLRELKVDANFDIVDLNIDKTVAQPGSYQFEVDRMARKSSAFSSGFADKEDSYVGVGFIQYTLPNGETKDVFIDSDNSSLEGIARLINSDSSLGLRANIINDGSGSDTPWRLLVNLKDTGDGQNAEFPYFYLVDGEKDFYLEFEREAEDALVKIEGFEVEIPSNSTSELIKGVTIDLKKAAPGEEFTINITEDSEAITEKVSSIIDKINEILKFIKDQNTLDEGSDTTRTLGGDLLLQSLESRLRSAIFRPISTSAGMRRGTDLGVKFQRSGFVKFEESSFNALVEKNFGIVTQILTGTFTEDGNKTPGLIDHLQKVATNSLRSPDGLLRSRAKVFQSKIDQIDRRIKTKERTIATKEKNLKDKFARLEGTISKIKSQSAGVASLGAAQAQNPVQQLG
jgi:flagellar hook-associated protein 2